MAFEGEKTDLRVGNFELELFSPLNPALTAILNSNQMRAISLAAAVRAKALYVDMVARDYDPRFADVWLHLQSTVQARTIKTFTSYGPRWTGEMSVERARHFLPHEFGWTDPRTEEYHEGAHDLNQVLEMMAV